MKTMTKLFFVFFVLMTTEAFAIPVNIAFVNKTAAIGYGVINGTQSQIIERLGGTVSAQPFLINDSDLATVYFSAMGLGGPCHLPNSKMLALNAHQYQGDVVTITFYGDKHGSLQGCTCTGSACDATFQEN